MDKISNLNINPTFITYFLFILTILSLFYANKSLYGTEKYEYTKKINEEHHDLIITVITASLYFTVIGYNRINYDSVSNFTDNSIKILSFLIPFVFMTLSYPEIEHRSGFHYSFTTKNLSKFMPLIAIILLVVITYIGSYIHLAKNNNNIDYSNDIQKLFLIIVIVLIFSSISYKKSKNIIIDETAYTHCKYTSSYRLHHWYIFFVLTIINVLFIDYNTNKYFYVFANLLSGLSFGCYMSGALIYGYGKMIETGKPECISFE